ncbi:hypothetical protein [Pseudomonas sp. Marseille-P9899]|uniref:hypothetical protein n=1 Tax=Pseudomonas sp. Marseille-P9899 TaxID=2730401 RepID=UPI00158E034B|nr:hypothetical protein [Pseudomonas sp. Marseille-P9899]
MNRYSGRPFLKLLENYVLDVLGFLGEGDSRLLVQMQPKLAEVYSMEGTWQEIVSVQMDFPDSFPEKIKLMWDSYLRQALVHGVTGSPQEFAVIFVDQNFPDI